MFTVLYGANRCELATTSQVLAFITDRCLSHDERQSIEVHGPQGRMPLFRGNGKVGLRLPGDAQGMLRMLLVEARADASWPDGRPRLPWQMRRLQWRGLVALRQLAAGIIPGFDHGALDVRVPYVNAVGKPDSGPIQYWFNAEFRKAFSYEAQGPSYHAGDVNDRHEVQVAYALARNAPIPPDVLDEYTEGGFECGLSWARTLMRCPTLRGRLSLEQLHALHIVLECGEKQPIEPDHVERVVEIAQAGPARPSTVQMDDLLFTLGVIKSRPVPPDAPADLTGVSPFAMAVRKAGIEHRHAAQRKREAEERAKGRLSLREMEFNEEVRRRDWQCATATFGQIVEQHIERRDIAALLDLLDGPDDHNPATKRVIEARKGIKLLGVKASERRTAIYRLAGMDAAEQMLNEHLRRKAETDMRQRNALETLVAQVSCLRYRMDDGTELDGKAYVEHCIFTEGARTIRAHKQGTAKRYWLLRPDHALRPLRANNGTLDYARHLLAQIAKDKQAQA